MSFAEVKLHQKQIVDLYKNVLIQTETLMNSVEKVVENSEIKKSLEFLGEHKKHVTIIIQDPNAVHISDDKLDFLTNLLTACKLSLADVAIINLANKNIQYRLIKDSLQTEYLILMGIDIKQFQLPIIFPKNKIQQFDNCNMLIAEDIGLLMGVSSNVKTEKKALWSALKQMFNL